MDWFLWFLAVMFFWRAIVGITIAACKQDNQPLPKLLATPATNATTVGLNVALCMGVLIYGGVL
jgi:hypothetical protein